jgi:signal transduction histidine kinase
MAAQPEEMDIQANSINNYYIMNGNRLEEISSYLTTDAELMLFQQAIESRTAYHDKINQLLQLRTCAPDARMDYNFSYVIPAFNRLTGSLSGFSTGITSMGKAIQTGAKEEIRYFQRAGTGLLVLAICLILALAFLTFRIIERLRAEKSRLENEMEQRKRAMFELESTNKELESFAYSVSHDLRTPLRSLEGFSEALAEDYQDKLDEHGKRYLSRIQDASIMMSRLIDDILSLSRITRSEMKKETVNLSKIAQSVVEDLRKNDPGRQVEVTIFPDIIVLGDAHLLRILLENLLGNSWKFTSKTPYPKIEVGVSVLEGSVNYFVKDNGAGFNMAYINKLFQPFQRLHKSADFPGTGIGLATVQRIIQRHGGRIWAEGNEGEGAVFYFTLNRQAGENNGM